MIRLEKLEAQHFRSELVRRVRWVVDGFLRDCNAKDADIVRQRWLSDPPMPLRELGLRHGGVCREAIRQREAVVVARLGARLREVFSADELAWLGVVPPVAAPPVVGASVQGAPPPSSPAEGWPLRRAARRPRAPKSVLT